MKNWSKLILCFFGLILSLTTFATEPQNQPPLNKYYPNLNSNYKGYGPFHGPGRCIKYRRRCNRYQICRTWSEKYQNAYWYQGCFMCYKPRPHKLEKMKATCKYWYMRRLTSKGFYCRPSFFSQYYFGPDHGFCNNWYVAKRCNIVCVERAYH